MGRRKYPLHNTHMKKNRSYFLIPEILFACNCMSYDVYCARINKSAHSPHTCWRPACVSGPLCRIYDTSTPWLPVTRPASTQSTHPVRQPPVRQPPVRRHRSTFSLRMLLPTYRYPNHPLLHRRVVDSVSGPPDRSPSQLGSGPETGHVNALSSLMHNSRGLPRRLPTLVPHSSGQAPDESPSPTDAALTVCRFDVTVRSL
jgi:hypothetical protein